MLLDSSTINELPLRQNNQKLILNYNYNKKQFEFESKSPNVVNLMAIVVIDLVTSGRYLLIIPIKR